MIIVPGTLLASSIHRNQKEKWGPQFAADSLWVNENYSIFLSKIEDFPWIQWHLSTKTNISAITVSIANHGTVLDSRIYEIRVGYYPTSPGTKGKVLTNTICGKFLSSGNHRRVHTVTCATNILAEYLTVQIIENASKMAINEIEIIPTSEGIS